MIFSLSSYKFNHTAWVWNKKVVLEPTLSISKLYKNRIEYDLSRYSWYQTSNLVLTVSRYYPFGCILLYSCRQILIKVCLIIRWRSSLFVWNHKKEIQTTAHELLSEARKAYSVTQFILTAWVSTLLSLFSGCILLLFHHTSFHLLLLMSLIALYFLLLLQISQSILEAVSRCPSKGCLPFFYPGDSCMMIVWEGKTSKQNQCKKKGSYELWIHRQQRRKSSRGRITRKNEHCFHLQSLLLYPFLFSWIFGKGIYESKESTADTDDISGSAMNG